MLYYTSGASLAEKELFLFLSQLIQKFSFKPVPGEKVHYFMCQKKQIDIKIDKNIAKNIIS